MQTETNRSFRYAAIDIGTVTCRLLVADVVDGDLSELVRRVEITNLGMGVDKTGVLAPDAIERVSSTVASYRAQIDSLRLSPDSDVPVIALATSASRDAKNAQELVDALEASRVRLSVIPGQREAALSFKGASRGYAGEDLVVVDVGGGSTEVVFGKGGSDPWFRHSFDIGCRRVTERFLKSDPPAKSELEEARSWIVQVMKPVIAEACEKGGCGRVVAVAGTATSMVSIDEKMEAYDPDRVNGAHVSAETLKRIYSELSSMTLSQRRQVVGLEPKRASVIVAGALILGCVLELLDVDGFTVSESDILQGIILDAAGL